MVIHIKNMVCVRCKMLVKKILDDMELPYHKIELGEVELKNPVTKPQKEILKDLLKIWGLVLIEDGKEILVAKIKSSIINMVHNDATMSPLKISHYLSHYLNYNYTYLANVFSRETGICLRDFIIAHKIERAKGLLIYEGFTVTEIAWKLNYSSVAHLSNQFNKITGLTPSQFKKNTGKPLIPLEEIGMLEAV
ncbi:MAG: AraC family transcriptional regulator [Ferruginibacter sp.]|nr:AraC family transcriptional regulator [Ferruginibacter sp.]